jgi:hypothetical protein
VERLILPEINSRIDEELDGTGPLSYKQVTQEQHDEAVTKCLEFLAADVLESGEAYLDKWERGWGENLAEFESLELGEEALTAIAPKFVRKGSPVKLRGKWIMPNHPNFERDWVSLLREFLADSHFSKVNALYEFGSGTGHNLVHFSSLLPGIKLFGYDWSLNSVHLQNAFAEKASIPLVAQRLDLFHPESFEILSNPSESALLTVGTIEQLGTNYAPVLNQILKSGFGVVVHIETTYELYNPENIVDFLSIKYLEKGNWARGYFAQLDTLQKSGEIEILEQGRTFGSFYHEGYTVTVWRPCINSSTTRKSGQ